MAVIPPTGPVPPNDGSSIFRRSTPKSSSGSGPPPLDDLNPEEPTDLVDADPDSVPLDEMPTGPEPSEFSLPNSESLAEEILFADEEDPPARSGDSWSAVTGESSVDLDSDGRPPVPDGAEWYDQPAGPPSTAKFGDAADLFADLSGNTPDSDTNWVRAENTGRVSDSELLRAFDEVARQTEDPSSEYGFSPPGSEEDARSSIFGKMPDRPTPPGAGEPPPSVAPDSAELTDLLHDDVGEGSSIFQRTGHGQPVPAPEAGEASQFDFELPVPTDPAGASQASGRIDLGNPDDVGVSASGRAISLDDLDLDAAEAAANQSAIRHSPDSPVPTVSGRTSRTTGGRTVRTLPVADEADADEPTPASGLGRFVGGVAFGLLLAGVAFGGLYLGGVIPNERKGPSLPARVATTDQDTAAKLDALQAQLDETKQAASTRIREFEAQLTAANAEADAVKQKLTESQTAAAKSATSLDTARTELAQAKMTVEAVRGELSDTRKAAEAATADLLASKNEAAILKRELETTKKAAETALTAIENQKKSAEDVLAGVVSELRTAKLIGPDEDAAKLPAAVKRLATVAGSGDVKQVTEELLAARKQVGTLEANLKSAAEEVKRVKGEADTARATAEAIKTDADKKVTAMKAERDQAVAEVSAAAENKLKASVAAATKDLSAELAQARKQIETAKAGGRAEAEAAAKQRVDELTQKVAALEAQQAADRKGYEQKLANQAADFASRLSEARSGETVRITSAEAAALDQARRDYAMGLIAFNSGRLTDAEAEFGRAVTGNAGDARYWYYLGLARYQLGRSDEAVTAFRKGAELEARGKPNSRAVSEAFERMPLRLRAVLKQYRP